MFWECVWAPAAIAAPGSRERSRRSCFLPTFSLVLRLRPAGFDPWRTVAHILFFDIIRFMTKLLQEAVAEVSTLPEDEQNRAAQVLLAFARDRSTYTLDLEQIEDIKHATGQADRGEFASDVRVRKIFGRAL